MRLIDADELIKQGWRLERHGQSNELVGVMSIADVPTAFNLEEVVEELEQMLESLSDCGDDWFTAEKINDAIEIVKGGVNHG